MEQPTTASCSVIVAPPPVAEDELMPLPRDRCYTWPLQPALTVANATASDSSTAPSEENIVAAAAKRKRSRKRPTDAASTKKPNPWGDESYSDLIAYALSCAPNGRMKLNEIYQWFADNRTYFRERSSQEEAAGWKNSIRHNLSLHSRFMRIQNEGAGKSSWWVINPEAKPGRNPRRRAQTLETSSKAASAIEKKRGRVRRKVAEMRAAQQGQTLHSASSSVVGSQASLAGHDLYPDDDSLGAGGIYDSFRPRTQSNLSVLSVPGSSARVSPSMEGTQQRLNAFDAFDDFPFESNPMIPNDILDRTDQIRLDAPALDVSPLGPPPYHQGLNGIINGDQMINGLTNSHNSVMPTSQSKLEPGIRMNIKQEPGMMQHVQPPPSYQELNTVRGSGAQLQNPLLRGQLSHHHSLGQAQNHQQQQQLNYNRTSTVPMSNGGGDYFRMVTTSNGVYATAGNNGWQTGVSTPISCAQQLPMDLANLSLPNEPGMEMDVAEVLRHEMAATGGKLDFGDFANNL